MITSRAPRVNRAARIVSFTAASALSLSEPIESSDGMVVTSNMIMITMMVIIQN